jgi:hypothetical protein
LQFGRPLLHPSRRNGRDNQDCRPEQARVRVYLAACGMAATVKMVRLSMVQHAPNGQNNGVHPVRRRRRPRRRRRQRRRQRSGRRTRTDMLGAAAPGAGTGVAAMTGTNSLLFHCDARRPLFYGMACCPELSDDGNDPMQRQVLSSSSLLMSRQAKVVGQKHIPAS